MVSDCPLPSASTPSAVNLGDRSYCWGFEPFRWVGAGTAAAWAWPAAFHQGLQGLSWQLGIFAAHDSAHSQRYPKSPKEEGEEAIWQTRARRILTLSRHL